MSDNAPGVTLKDAARDWIETSIAAAQSGIESAHHELVNLFREAVNAGEFPDKRITEYVLSVLEDGAVVRALYRGPRHRKQSDENVRRDLALACEVVRYLAGSNEIAAIAAVAEKHAHEGISESVVKKAFNSYRKAARNIEQ